VDRAAVPPVSEEELTAKNAKGTKRNFFYRDNSMKGFNNKGRCPWVDLTKPDYVEYHDREWGVPVHDDRTIFEFLTLEAAQAGLSWYTVLRKRAAYRDAFAGFDPQKVARYGKKQIAALLKNPGIIRNRLKIEAAVNNAGKFLLVQREFGSFDAYIWRFVDGRPIVNRLKTLRDYPTTSRESDALSKDLKQRGFKFVGSTIIYAHMQATGMVNDHVEGCFRRQPIIAGHRHLVNR
jgi:DNA-3-methyladenine glycosylase I